jgi:hypothetical protein
MPVWKTPDGREWDDISLSSKADADARYENERRGDVLGRQDFQGSNPWNLAGGATPRESVEP